MPKIVNEKVNVFNDRMVKDYPNVLKADVSVLFCILCNCNINGGKTYNVKQHFQTMKHKAALMKNSGPKQLLLAECSRDLNSYNLDLCKMLLEANIPLFKINNSAVKTFLQKYTNSPVPSETTLRTKYMPSIYESVINTLQRKAANNNIWVSMDETTDSEHRLVANFVFGILDEEEKGKSYLLNMDHIPKANASTMAAFFTNSLQILWPDGTNIIFLIFQHITYFWLIFHRYKIRECSTCCY